MVYAGYADAHELARVVLVEVGHVRDERDVGGQPGAHRLRRLQELLLAVVHGGHEVERVRPGGLHGLRLGDHLLERDDLVRAEDLVRRRERAELAVVRARRRVQADVRVDLRLAPAQLRGERTARLLDGERLGREVLHRQQGHDLLLVEQASVERLVDDADDLGAHETCSPFASGPAPGRSVGRQ